MSEFAYLRKPVPVEAFRIPPDDNQLRAWPRWFLPDIAMGVLVPQPGGAVSVRAAHRNDDKTANPGEWLVRNEDGSYEVYENETFKATFEKAASAADRG